jgi:MFS family permease
MTFLLGAALFGAMLVIALYYQEGRGQSALSAGLLMAPQGVGAALAMPLAGRLTDRIGSGPVVLAGVIAICAGTLGSAHARAHTPFALLSVSLVIRGIGLGAAMMPAMAAAYATLRPDQVPRATSALNAVQRVGGSIGTAVLAIMLQHQLASSGHRIGAPSLPGGPPSAAAFAHTFRSALGLSLPALAPALTLAIIQHRAFSCTEQAIHRSSGVEPTRRIRRTAMDPARRVVLDTDQP